jgi:hypothetical protein
VSPLRSDTPQEKGKRKQRTGDPDRPLSVTDLTAIGLAALTATAVVDPLLH